MRGNGLLLLEAGDGLNKAGVSVKSQSKGKKSTNNWFESSKRAAAFESSTSCFRLSSSSLLSLKACSRSRSSAVTLSCARVFLLSSMARLSSSSSRLGLLPARPLVPFLRAAFSSSWSSSGISEPRIMRSRMDARVRLSSRSRASSSSRLVISFAFCRTLAPWSFPSSSIY